MPGERKRGDLRLKRPGRYPRHVCPETHNPLGVGSSPTRPPREIRCPQGISLLRRRARDQCTQPATRSVPEAANRSVRVDTGPCALMIDLPTVFVAWRSVAPSRREARVGRLRLPSPLTASHGGRGRRDSPQSLRPWSRIVAKCTDTAVDRLPKPRASPIRPDGCRRGHRRFRQDAVQPPRRRDVAVRQDRSPYRHPPLGPVALVEGVEVWHQAARRRSPAVGIGGG